MENWLGDDAIENVGLILTFIQIAVLIGSIFPTEKALKRTFPSVSLRASGRRYSMYSAFQDSRPVLNIQT